MKRALLFLGSTAMLALAACGQKHDASPEAVPNNSAAAPATAPVTASAAQIFANKAAASDMFEIEASKLAETNAASASIKKFALAMIKGHMESTDKLRVAASSTSPAILPDSTLTTVQQQTLDTLKTKKGAEFDSAYAIAQVQAHEEALGALRDYAAEGDLPSLKNFAAGLVPIVTGHLNMAKGLKT